MSAMEVDPPAATRDFYKEEEHVEMDKIVMAKLVEAEVLWRHNPSLLELRFVLQSVVEGDQKLDQKFVDGKNFPGKIKATLCHAWKVMSFREIRILSYLQASDTEDFPSSSSSGSLAPEELATLAEAMTHEYKGDSAAAFIKYMERNNIAYGQRGQTYYGKFCSITQSSGTGKTRLLLQLGKSGICVLYLNIRSEDRGYPSCDVIPAHILAPGKFTKEEYHVRCQTFFATLFKCLVRFLEGSSSFSVLSDVENVERTKFLEQIKDEFTNVRQEVLLSPGKGTMVMLKYFNTLVSSKRLRKKKNWPKVVIALDEAHVLHEKQNQNYLPAAVFLKTIKEYSSHTSEAVWVVFASTVSKIVHYASPQSLFPSERVALEGQLLFPPFTQLGWDQHVPALSEVELDKVAWASHLILYGRPLWWSLKVRTAGKIISLAAQKLCGSMTFDPGNKHQAFAVLAQRFGLDIAFGHRNAIQYNDTSIASHLRICIKTTEDRMWCYTTYPSEPIVSAVAAEVLYEEQKNLSVALSSLSLLVNEGLINIGDTGELASRFLWLLAKDHCVQELFVESSDPDNLDTKAFDLASPEPEPSYPSTSITLQGDLELPYCTLVPIIKYLQVVFGATFWDKASEALAEFQDAYINFSHWIQMDFDITRGNKKNGELNDFPIELWTQSLWARTCAIQCCHNQPIIDKVIPLYFKSQPRNSAMSHIMISDKAREAPQRDLLGKITRSHDNITGSWSGPPYIAILADLGTQSSDLIVEDDTKNKMDPCLRIYAAGLNQSTYPFLEPAIAQTLNDLYGRQPVPPGPKYLKDLEAQMQFGLSRELCYMNHREVEEDVLMDD